MLVSIVVFAIAATITPGPATTLASSSGINFGYRRSLPLILGIGIGLGSLAFLASMGLVRLLLDVPTLHLTLKVMGSAYLLWLAWKIGTSGSPDDTIKEQQKPYSLMTGAMLLWLNPKGWAMTISAAAAFSSLGEGPYTPAFVLGPAFVIAALFSLSLWCIAGVMLSQALRTETQWRIVNIALSILLASSIAQIWI